MTSEEKSRIRVLVVDDLPAARRVIRSALEEDPTILVVGEASNGREAVEMALRLRPDVITMDVVMPVMDGYTATARIMSQRPTPIVAVTSLATSDGTVLSRMMSAGAIDLVNKGFARQPAKQARMRRELVAKVKAAAQAKVFAPRSDDLEVQGGGDAPVHRLLGTPRHIEVVVVAASTGGPNALATLLGGLPEGFPCPVLVVQHIAPGFTIWLARWLDQAGALHVKVGEDGEQAEPGKVYLAPEDRHLLVTPQLGIRTNEALPVHGVRPSGDILFRSAAQSFGSRAVGVVLTGMGSDGAEGSARIKEAGGVVLVQDAETSAVFGMGRATVAAGAATAVLPIQSIAGRLVVVCSAKEGP